MSTAYRGTHNLSMSRCGRRAEPDPSSSPSHPATARAILPSLFFFFSGDEARQRRRSMSSSATSSRRSWPRYGEVPMTRCPDCPRTVPLKWLVTSTDKNGNLGREFVKCESKPEPGKVRSESSERQFLFLFRNFWIFIGLGI
jgi:hypothetical protein